MGSKPTGQDQCRELDAAFNVIRVLRRIVDRSKLVNGRQPPVGVASEAQVRRLALGLVPIHVASVVLLSGYLYRAL